MTGPRRAAQAERTGRDPQPKSPRSGGRAAVRQRGPQATRQTPSMAGTLDWTPALDRPELLAGPVVAALGAMPDHAASVRVAEIDPVLADTAAFCETYGVALDISANCVVLAAKRSGETQLAACLV